MSLRRSERSTTIAHVRVYSDPLQHAAIAATVVAPLVPLAGPRVIATAMAAGLLIDLDHVVAARSVRVAALTSLATRPRSHSLLTATGVGAVVAAAAGPLHGWAAWAGLASHLVHDAGDRAAATPLLWPFAPAAQIGRRRQAAATAALVVASVAVSRVAAAASRARSAAAGDGDGSARPQTA